MGIKNDASIDDEPLGIEPADEGADAGGEDGAQDETEGAAQDGDQVVDQAQDKGDEIQIEFVDTDDAGQGGADEDAAGGKDGAADDSAGQGGADEDANEPDPRKDPKYSKNVQERINRERKVTARERTRAETAERGFLAEAGKNAILSLAFAESRVRELNGSIERVKAEMKKHREAGDTDKDVEAQAELGKLQADLAQIERVKPDLEQRAKDAREGKLMVRGGPQQASSNPLADQWKARNRWFADPRFKADAGYTAMIDRELAAEGMDKNDPAYFTELDRRIRERMPTLLPRWRQASGQAPQKKAGPGAAQGGGARTAAPARPAAGAAASKGKVIITAVDKDFMRSMGMDPANKEHLQAFARERLASQQGAKK